MYLIEVEFQTNEMERNFYGNDCKQSIWKIDL